MALFVKMLNLHWYRNRTTYHLYKFLCLKNLVGNQLKKSTCDISSSISILTHCFFSAQQLCKPFTSLMREEQECRFSILIVTSSVLKVIYPSHFSSIFEKVNVSSRICFY